MTPAINSGIALSGGNGTTRQVRSGLTVSKRSYTPWWLSGGIAAANCIALYQSKGAASYAVSKVNLVNPGTYDLAEVGGALNWSAVGWVGISGRYFDTQITMGAGYTVIARVNDSANSYQHFISGGDYPTAKFGFCPRWIDYGGNILFTNYKNAGVSGVGDHVIALAGTNGYVDGILKVTGATAPNSTARIYTQVGGIAKLGIAVAFYNTTLTAAQVAAVSTAMAAL